MVRTSSIVWMALFLTLAAAPAASARDATVTSFDGTQIAVHFFPAAGAAAGAKGPTVLFGPGWGSGGATDDEGATDTGTGIVGVGPLRHAGYNVVTWDPRGFGSSGGTVEVDSPPFEGRDVQAIIDFVARQPEAQLDAPGDPRLGMSGGSYGGGIQLVTAAIDRRVDAIVPDIAWHSLVTSQYKQQTVKTGWAAILYALGVEGSHNRLDPALTQTFTDATTSGTLTPPEVDYFATRGPGDLVDRIRIPTFLMQGTVDTLFTLQEAITNYQALRASHVPLKMLWFCGGHGACLTSPGDLGAMQREELAWLARYLKRDTSVDTGPGFEWVDQDGGEHTAASYPPRAGAALAGEGSGTLALADGGGSGPAAYANSANPTGVIAAPVAASRATNAVDVRVGAARSAQQILGAPRVTLTYTGTGAETTTATKVFGQVVDDATGKVLGNQITPIPVTLDGKPHTVSQPLEIVAAAAKPGETFTLQLVAQSTAYNVQRSGGAVTFSQVHVELPTLAAGTASAAAVPAPRSCASRRAFTIHVRAPRGARIRRARATLAGRRLHVTVSGQAARSRVRLTGRRRGVVRLIVRLVLRGGRVVTARRTYHPCQR
jgi:ABC-2 type transport system ATP-binding protein